MIETVIPRTGNGKSLGAWAKTLLSVDPQAKDGYGFEGRFIRRGAPIDLEPGTLVLECAGATRPGEDKLYILWVLDHEGEWEELERAAGPAWALEIRDEALTQLENR